MTAAPIQPTRELLMAAALGSLLVEVADQERLLPGMWDRLRAEAAPLRELMDAREAVAS